MSNGHGINRQAGGERVQCDENMRRTPGHSMNYAGPSMNPTLEVGDGLKVLPYCGKRIRAGDVVVFKHPVEGKNVVHRVIQVNDDGICTRGDNNNQEDPWLLQPDQIIGRVVHVIRKDETRTLAGGTRGRMWAGSVRTRKWLRACLVGLLRPIYRGLADSGLFRGCLGRRGQPRVVCFTRHHGVEMHLFLGSRRVGLWRAWERRWYICAPFRLFVDERTLPQSPPAATREHAQGK
jgi:signal peptidase